MSRLSARVWRLAALGACAAASVFVIFIGGRSYFRETREFFPQRRPIELSAAAAGLPGMEVVAFEDVTGAVLRGWYVPSANRAAVILLHGAGGDRTSLLPEAHRLTASGLGVLVFDWPGQGESDGQIHWNAGEARALVAATNFLARRSDLDVRRLGALGFSMGGAVLARVAPLEPRLRALAFVGTPSDQVKQIDFENRDWGALSQLPARWAVQRGGVPLYENQPVERIGAIAPRPVLIVNGTDDQVVPLFLARDLFAAANEPKALLLVSGAGHVGYEHAPGSTYLDQLAAFFEGALLQDLADENTTL